MSKTSLALAVATAAVAFPSGTADTAWTFTLSGTNADGTPYAETFDSNTSSVDHDFEPGTKSVVLVVTKNGISSLPSDPFDVPADSTVPVTITLTVPDSAQKATIAAAAAPAPQPAPAPAPVATPAPAPVSDAPAAPTTPAA